MGWGGRKYKYCIHVYCINNAPFVCTFSSTDDGRELWGETRCVRDRSPPPPPGETPSSRYVCATKTSFPGDRNVDTPPRQRTRTHDLLYKVETLKIIYNNKEKKKTEENGHTGRQSTDIIFTKRLEKNYTLGPIRLYCVCVYVRQLLLLLLTFLWTHCTLQPPSRHRRRGAASVGATRDDDDEKTRDWGSYSPPPIESPSLKCDRVLRWLYNTLSCV